MISYREEYFRSFIKEDILKTSSFKALYKKVDEVNFFGPSLDKEDEGFIEDARKTLDMITSIFRKPHITIKDEEAIMRSSLAPNLDPVAFLKTVEDTSLWKRKNGRMLPENVHVNLVQETFILYENIFICRVLDFIKQELGFLYKLYERRAGSLDNKFETTQITFGGFGFISNLKQFDYPYKNILSDESKSIYSKSKKVKALLKKCVLLETTPFYKEVGIARARRRDIIMTNILLKDKKYNVCYKFYKQYISQIDEVETLELYKDYLFLRMVKELKEEYIFTPYSHTLDLAFAKHLRIDKKISLYNKYFNYYIEKVSDGFIVSSKLREDESIGASYFILPVLDVNKGNIKQIKQKIKDKALEGYDSVTCVALRNNTMEHSHIVSVSFFEDDDKKGALKNIFRSYSMLFACEFDLYKEMCPVCTSTGIKQIEENYKCGHCGSLYREIDVDEKEALWLKVVGRSY